MTDRCSNLENCLIYSHFKKLQKKQSYAIKIILETNTGKSYFLKKKFPSFLYNHCILRTSERIKTFRLKCASLEERSKYHEKLKQLPGNGNMSAWRSDVWDCAFLSKAVCVNHMKCHGRWQQFTFPSRSCDTICVICCKFSKVLSGLKRFIAVHEIPSSGTESSNFYS